MTIPEQAVEAGARAVIERANVRASCIASEICVAAPCPCAEDIARAVITAAQPLLGVQRPDREKAARTIADCLGRRQITPADYDIADTVLALIPQRVQRLEDAARALYRARQASKESGLTDEKIDAYFAQYKASDPKISHGEWNAVWRAYRDAAVILALPRTTGQPQEGWREVLREIEWGATDIDVGGVEVNACPWCGGHEPAHTKKCKLAALISPAPASPRAEGWQPIATAPKDGAFIDLWHVQMNRRVSDCRWRDSEKPDHCGWFAQSGGLAFNMGHDSNFSHWRPLPAPPAIVAEKQTP